jgi:hypothetical protein
MYPPSRVDQQQEEYQWAQIENTLSSLPTATETALARKRTEDAKTAIKQVQEDMRSTESGGLTSKKPGRRFEEMLDAIGSYLSDHASSDDAEDGEDADDTEQGKQSEDDEHGWVMGTISKTVQ